MAKKKAGTVFVDLTAAYYTVWHRGLTCKLLNLLPDGHLVLLIMEFVRNRNVTLTTGTGKQSRLRHLKNGVSQRLFLAPLLFNIYTNDLPVTVGGKFVYADDLAILHYKLAGIKGDFHSGHGNPIFLPLQMEPQARYNKDCVDSLPSLQQGGTAWA